MQLPQLGTVRERKGVYDEKVEGCVPPPPTQEQEEEGVEGVTSHCSQAEQ